MGQVWVENRLNFSSIEAFFNFIFGFESLHPHQVCRSVSLFLQTDILILEQQSCL